MKITLETVRSVLRRALGFESFCARFITALEASPDIPTACITADGFLRYNPEFVHKHVQGDADLFSLLFHELLHPMFGHFIHGQGMLQNIGADAIINAIIACIYPDASHHGHLFSSIYDPEGLQGLLRPDSQMTQSRYARLYNTLYSPSYHPTQTLSTGEVIQSLRVLTPREPHATFFLLGNHGTSARVGTLESAGQLSDFTHETLTAIAEELKHSAMERQGRNCGHGGELYQLLFTTLHSHRSLRREVLQRMAAQRKFDRFIQLAYATRSTTSPIPLHPTKKDLVLWSAGLMPFHYRYEVTVPKHQHSGLAIYLDVSGSVNEYLPRILGVLRPLQREISTIYQFSDKVAETSFDSLLAGNIDTTGGTDFDCIAQSLLNDDRNKAVIITDGYSSLAQPLSDQLAEKHLKTLTVLFDRTNSCRDFARFGDVVQLEDICH